MKVKYWAALAAVFAVAAGSATAGPTVKKLITGQDIKDGSIGLVDLSSSTKTNLKGQRGAAGQQGSQGAKGDTGPAGQAGPQGLKGDTGAAGSTGSQGLQGPKGDTGSVGKGLVWQGAWTSGNGYAVGDAVRFNSSAYVATKAVPANTLQDPAANTGSWDVLFTGVGPQGVAGPAGPAGAAGPAGPAGAQGGAGPQGPQGAQGVKGDTGISGYTFVPITLYADPAKTNPQISSTDIRVDTATCPNGGSVLAGGVAPTGVPTDEAPGGDPPPYVIQTYWSAPVSQSTWAVSWGFNGGFSWVTVEMRLTCATVAG